MYGYDDHTTPLWLCTNKTCIMPLPSTLVESAIPITYTPMWVNQSPPHDPWLFWTNQVKDVSTKVWVYSYSYPSALQMVWFKCIEGDSNLSQFLYLLLWRRVVNSSRNCCNLSGSLRNFFVCFTWYACGQASPIKGMHTKESRTIRVNTTVEYN